MIGRRVAVAGAVVHSLSLSGLSGRSKGQTLRGTASLAVKAALKDKKIDYKDPLTCTGDHLPISCTGITPDGRSIAGTLTSFGNNCMVVVTVTNQQIARQSARCK